MFTCKVPGPSNKFIYIYRGPKSRSFETVFSGFRQPKKKIEKNEWCSRRSNGIILRLRKKIFWKIFFCVRAQTFLSLKIWQKRPQNAHFQGPPSIFGGGGRVFWASEYWTCDLSHKSHFAPGHMRLIPEVALCPRAHATYWKSRTLPLFRGKNHPKNPKFLATQIGHKRCFYVFLDPVCPSNPLKRALTWNLCFE